MDYIFLILVFFASLLGILLVVVYIKYFLEDRRIKQQAIPIYESPAGLRPIVLAMVLNGQIGIRGVVAEILTLASFGYINFSYIEGKTVLSRALGDKDIEEFEFRFLDKLFSGVNEVPLEYIISNSSNIIPAVERSLREHMNKDIYPKYFSIRRPSLVKALVFIGLASFVFMFIFAAYAVLLFVIGLLCLFIGGFFVRHAKQHEKLIVEIHGFIDYLKTAEIERLEFHNSPENKKQVFDPLLPYAIALGLENTWMKKIEDISRSVRRSPVFAPGGVMEKEQKKTEG